MERGIGVGAAIAAVALAGLALAPAALGSPYIHAHRGGSLVTVKGEQKPLYPEQSMPAFRHAAKAGFVLEMDAQVTADDRVVLLHDAELDRTTDCTGLASEKTLAEIRHDCEIDVLGTDIRDDTSRRLGPDDERRARVPTLALALRTAKKYGVDVSLEVKNYATNPDFDPSGDFQRRVAQQVIDSAFPPGQLIVQSFSPVNFEPFTANPYFDDARISYLSLAATNEFAASIAAANGADFVSPAWPYTDAQIADAHDRGLQVAPYTLDTRTEIRDATRAGVDAIISDDPELARRVAFKASPRPPKLPKPPSAKSCRRVAADNSRPAIESYHRDDSGPRIFALQYKQDIVNVATYRDYRTKIECMLRTYVVPNLADDRPNVVALNEDVGVMTLATGSRAAGTRELFSDPANIPGCVGAPPPCGIVAALSSLDGAYASQESAYASRFGGATPFAQTFLAATDTFARGWMQTFSDLAKRYDVYILGSNNQAAFRESVDPTEIAAFADPDVAKPASAFVATSRQVYNEAFVWGPRNVTKDGPAPLRNVVYSNRKVPLTDIENALSLTPGPSTGPDAVENLRPYRIPGTKAKMSIATSLPAFIYDGDLSPFGEPLDPGIDPCSDTASYYMYCMDQLGANLVMQDEANPGRWASEGTWQPVEWMASSWRAVADPTVGFDYNVTPFMVGNLVDLVFDGQTSITQRGLKGPKGRGGRCHYVGDSELMTDPPESDPAAYAPYAGGKPQFLGLAPWVRKDAPRDELRATGATLAGGSGSPRENDYLETAVIADLPFPPDPRRANCLG